MVFSNLAPVELSDDPPIVTQVKCAGCYCFVVTSKIFLPFPLKSSIITNEINTSLLPFPSQMQSTLLNKNHLSAGM